MAKIKLNTVKTTYGFIQMFIREAYDDYGDSNARGFKDFLMARLEKYKGLNKISNSK
jgi:hypothetical protein